MQVKNELTEIVSTSTTVNESLKKYRDLNQGSTVNEHRDKAFERNPTGLDHLLPGSSRSIGKPEISSVIRMGRLDCVSGGDDDFMPPTEPPPMPEFKSVAKRVLVGIDEILEYPGRKKRPER